MIAYQVYGNNGTGGLIDYTTILATVTGTSFTPPALAKGGDYRFAVRAIDQSTGLVDLNTTAVVRITLDANGADLGLLPTPPIIIDCYRVGAMLRIDWSWTDPRHPFASSFQVFSGPTVIGKTPGGKPGRYGITVTPPAGATSLSVVALIGPATSPATPVAVPVATVVPMGVDGLTASPVSRPAS